MVRYILNENLDKSRAGDVTSYNNLEEISRFIEVVDVENGEFSLFDTDGYFYRIFPRDNSDNSGNFRYQKLLRDLKLANNIVDEFLKQCRVSFDLSSKLESKSMLIDRYR